MVAPDESAGMDGWLKPAKIAAVCEGRVVRTGRPARRVVTDTRNAVAGDGFVALRGESFDGHEFVAEAFDKGAAGAVVDSAADSAIETLGVPENRFLVAVPDTRRALLALAAEHRRRHAATVIGITGSCGKTSTKDLLGSVLAAQVPTVSSPSSFNNEVGVPLSLFQIDADTRFAVIEIGTNAPGEVAALSEVARPDFGVITCISEAHLNGLGSLNGVAEEKAGLFSGMSDDGIAILNGDDRACREIGRRSVQRAVYVRVDREADWFATDVQFHGLGTSFLLQGERPVTLSRLGSHNVYNALLCIAAATELGFPLDAVLEVLCRVPSTSRRMEYKQVGEVRVFDDTYNMNPASARAALHALAGIQNDGRKLVVFGEMLELGDRAASLHKELGRRVADSGVDLLVTVGEAAKQIADGARRAGLRKRKIVHASDPSHALELLLGELRPRDLVLCKASRKVGLDRLVDGLTRELGPGEPGHNEPRQGEPHHGGLGQGEVGG